MIKLGDKIKTKKENITKDQTQLSKNLNPWIYLRKNINVWLALENYKMKLININAYVLRKIGFFNISEK